MSTYATLAQARAELIAPDANTQYDGVLMEYLSYITSRIDLVYKTWRFEPVVQTRYQDYGNVNRHLRRLCLDAPLLSASAILDGDGATLTLWDGAPGTRAAAEVAPSPLNDTPAGALVKLHDDDWQNSTDDQGVGAISITGIWGYRRGFAGAWKSSGDALTGNTLSGATSWPVTDPDAADITGRTPRFSPGQLVRIGTEYANVTATNGTANTVSVEPAVNGTTAAAHTSGDTIYTWYPDPVIIRATLRWADFLFNRRGKFDVVTYDGMGSSTKYPEDMPKEVQTILDQIPDFMPEGVTRDTAY